MRFHSLRALFRSKVRKTSAQGCPRRRFRPTFDLLEDRRLLSATLWVDPSNPHDFQSIGDAVAAAHSGDTIKVAPGTYPESLTVNVNIPLTILGGQPHNPTQHGPSVVQNDGVAFTLNANGISLQGFTIEPYSAPTGIAGIVTEPDAGYSILNNVIEYETYGVHFNTTTTGSPPTSTISGNCFLYDGDGIFTDVGLKNATICSNTFVDNSNAAVDIMGSTQSTNVQVLNNQISGGTGATMAATPQTTAELNEPFVISNGPEESDAEIVLANATCSKIDGNCITNPPDDGILLGGGVTSTEVAHNLLQSDVGTIEWPCSDGIELDPACVATPDSNDCVTCNTVVATEPDTGFTVGILLDDAGKNTVTGNTVQGSLEDGIELADGSSCNTVSGNSSCGNLGNGIEVSDSNSNCVSKNTATSNTLDGILLDNEAFYNSVSCNTANCNGNNGIEVTGSSLVVELAVNSVKTSAPVSNTISGNTTNTNAADGISVNNSNYVTVCSNTSCHNGDDGINLVHAASNIVSCNTANYNTVNGIALNQSDTTGNTVSGNTANHNTGDGIALLNGASSNTISGNSGDNNGGNGLELTNPDSNDNTISLNKFLNNVGAGIFVHSECSGNTITKNTATGNGFYDLFDASSGGGTDGTANFWSQNTANTRSPAGLQ